MFFTATKSLVAGLVLLAVIALTAGQGGPCPNGAWPDKGGCCPVVIGNVPYYRDASGCYPRLINNKLYYPDTNKCYPDANGAYPVAGATCPAAQKCDTSACIVFSQPSPLLGACGSGQPRDANNCCSRIVGNAPFYRDLNGCYPTLTSVGPRYADGLGCYPDQAGVYSTTGSCTATQPRCLAACDQL